MEPTRSSLARPALLLAATVLGLAGCPAPEFAIDRGPAYALSEDADASLAFAGIVGVPNIDDDNRNDEPDWRDADIEEDNDLSPFWVQPELWRLVKRNERLRLRMLDGDADVRVWHDGAIILGDNDGDRSPLEFELTKSDEPIRFDVEFRDYLVQADLELVKFELNGEDAESYTFGALASPLVMNHHNQPAELVMAVHVRYSDYNNDAFVAGYERVLDDKFMSVDGDDYFGDVWLQDEIEFATVSAPDTRIDFVIDSIRNRGLDNVAEDEFEAHDFLVRTWGSGMATSQDSFGNLEATPPFTLNGQHYPFGKTYWGDGGGDYQITPDLAEFFDSQLAQAPFVLDTSWLCVGHVDEFMSWIPVPGSRLGWKLVYTDIDGAWDVLERMDQGTSLPLYSQAHGVATVGEMVEDNGLRALNEDLWEDYLEPNLDIIKEETGITDDDIIWLPGLFEAASGCGGTTAALIPGMSNLIVANFPDETLELFMADPFLRTDSGDQDDDGMIPAVREVFGSEVNVNFIDDFWVYHYGLGEVHCGSNVIRTPVNDWWKTIGSLVED